MKFDWHLPVLASAAVAGGWTISELVGVGMLIVAALGLALRIYVIWRRRCSKSD